MTKKSLPLKQCQDIVNALNNKTASSFSRLNQLLSTVPGIKSCVTLDDKSGILTVLATLFDTSELVDASLDLPHQTPAQTITLETHLFPDKLCLRKAGTVDYSVGFRLGNKYAEVAYGSFHDMVRASA